jgi:hypothetical protein
MPGKAGKQLFEEYPLSDQSVLARANGRAGRGAPKTGKGAKRVAKTGKGAKGVPNTGKAAKGMPNTGGSAKGVPKTGKATKGAAHWRAGGDGVMQTPQDFLLAPQ